MSDSTPRRGAQSKNGWIQQLRALFFHPVPLAVLLLALLAILAVARSIRIETGDITVWIGK